MHLSMILLPQHFGITRLDPQMNVPHWALLSTHFVSVTRTEEELSILCELPSLPENVIAEKDWRGFKIVGPLDFSLAGILNTLTKPLADAKIPIFAISTFDTGYIFVKESKLSDALQALSQVCQFKG